MSEHAWSQEHIAALVAGGLTADEAAAGGYVSITTPPPNQLLHWITVPSGVADGTVLPSIIRVAGAESVVRLQIRVMGV